MNLKNACFIALIMAAISIGLTLLGQGLVYLQVFQHGVHWQISTNIFTGVLAGWLRTGGLLVFLLAMMAWLKNPESNAKTLFVLAGILVLLGSLIGLGMSLMHSVGLHGHLPLFQFMLRMATQLFSFLASLCMSAFAFTMAGRASSAKSPAAVTLAAEVVLGGLVLITTVSNFSQYFSGTNYIHIAGSFAMSLGYFIQLAAVLIFLLAFLKHRPWPPMAGVENSSPDPLPTLSAEAFPEQE